MSLLRGGLYEKNVKPHNLESNEKDKKMCFLRQGVHLQQRFAEVLLRNCAESAKAQRKKKQQDFIKAVEPVIDIASQEYLTFSKAAILMGCTRQYVYKLVNEGKLAASRISSRMVFIRKADIEQMLAGNPYHRVLPRSSQNKVGKRSSTPSSSLSSKKDNKHIPKIGMRFSEPLEYISGEDVMATYKVKKSWLYTSAKRNDIPMCKIAGKNYYSRKHMDELFGVTAEIEALTEWLTTEEAETLYSTTKESLRTQAYRRHIPTKREYGKTYYSNNSSLIFPVPKRPWQ